MPEDAGWYYAQDGRAVGPMTLAELRQRLPTIGGPQTLVYGPGAAEWIEARHVAALVGEAPAPPPVYSPGTRRSDEIDYEIFGSEMQYVEVTLDPGEMVIAEAGAMMYMTTGIQMETVFGDPSAPQGSFWSKVAAAGKRVITGESMFMTTFANAGHERSIVAFAAPFPGKIVPMHLDELGGELICQRDSFVCAARGTQIGIAFQRRFGVGLFGGEGFIMQRLTGDGVALVHAGGTLMRRHAGARRGAAARHRLPGGLAAERQLRHRDDRRRQEHAVRRRRFVSGHAYGPGRRVVPVVALLALGRADRGRCPADRPRRQGRRLDPGRSGPPARWR